ncbi:MAG: nuclear transport factor 2 family protein [Pseudomonadota bacterium]
MIPDQPELLEQAEYANEAFYLAFEAKDIDAMTNVWSSREDLICLHPGWPALTGRVAVLDSWRSILSNPQQGQVSVYNATCHLLGDECVMVICYESAGDAVMIATNIFQLDDGRMRMIAHQAGYCGQPPEPS